MSERFYDKGFTRFAIPLSANVAWTGTNTAAAQVLAATKRVIPFKAKLLSAQAFCIAGATDAVADHPVVTLMRATLGTGSFTAIGTAATGATDATGTVTAFTLVTGTNLICNALDVLAVQVAAGSTAHTSKTYTYTVAFEELFQ